MLESLCFPAKPDGLLKDELPLPLNPALLQHPSALALRCAAALRTAFVRSLRPPQVLERELIPWVAETQSVPPLLLHVQTTAPQTSFHWGTLLKHNFFSFSKVHVNLLLVEARMQAELLYALRAITRYMT